MFPSAQVEAVHAARATEGHTDTQQTALQGHWSVILCTVTLYAAKVLWRKLNLGTPTTPKPSVP